jgi:hypothetical protein
MLRWDRYRFDKKHTGTRYVEHAFLHPVQSVTHVVHSGVAMAQSINVLFFMLRWDRYRFYKNSTGTCYAELVFFHPV